MRENDWFISVLGDFLDQDSANAEHSEEKILADLSVIVELTRRRIEDSFDQSKRLKGHFRTPLPNERQAI